LTTLTVNLNEPYAPGSVGTDDVSLSMGSVVGFTLIDADTIQYQLSGINQEGTLTFSIAAGALTDVFGNPNEAFSGSVTLDFGTVPFPTPAVMTAPGGSLIYRTAISGNIQPSGDEDSFTILVDTGQTITVIVEKTDDTLQAAVSLYATDGGDLLVGSATAAAAGEDAVIRPVLVPGSLTSPGAPRGYKVKVSGAGGSTGTYSVRLILNAAAELEDHNGDDNATLATAQSLEDSQVTLVSGALTAGRLAVQGAVRGGVRPGDALVGVRSFNFFGGSVQQFDTNGNLTRVISDPIFDTGVISDVELGPDNVIYVALATDFGGGVASGELVKFDQNGTFLGTVPLPDDSDVGFLYPFGFDVAADGTIWVPQLNSGNLLHVSSDGFELEHFFVGGTPNDAAVRSDGQVFVVRADFSDIVQVDPGTGNVSFFASDLFGSPVNLNLGPGGNLWVGDFNVGPVEFDQFGNLISVFSDFGAIDPQVDLSNNLWVTNFNFGTVDRLDPFGNFQFGTPTAGGVPIGVAVLGIDSPTPLPPPDTTDYYSFDLGAGQSATIALDVTGGPAVTLELDDASGNPIAVGSSFGSLDQVISNFVAPVGGKYYIKVSGSGSEYSLVVTRNAAFDTGLNDSFDTAQAIVAPEVGGSRVVLGRAAGGAAAVLDAFDSGWYDNTGFHDPTNENYVTGLLPGAGELRNFFAFDPSGLPDGTITSAQFQAYNPGVGAGDFGDGFQSSDPTETYTLFNVTSPIGTVLGGGFGLTGIYNDLGSGLAYGSQTVSSADNGRLVTVTLSPAAVADLNTKLGGPFALGGDLTSLAGNSDLQGLFGFTFNDLGYAKRLLLTLVDSDYYKIDLATGATLQLDTATPAGLSGEFVNEFDPIVYVYDSAGNLVAVNDNGGAEGRNASLSYTAPAAGSYFIVVASSPATPSPTEGEYVLTIGGASPATSPFEVTATDPADGATLRIPPTTITVDFNHNILLSSLQASDLQVDGVPATGFTVVDGNTVVFDLVGGYTDGPHSVTIAAGALVDVQGTAISSYSGTFFMDQTGPRVTTTSLAPGAVVAPGSLSYQVTFNEPMAVGNLSADDFILHGTVLNGFYAPTSFSYNGSGTVVTVNYSNLPEDNYTLTLVAGVSGGSNFTDAVGNALDGEFSGSFPSGDGVPGGDFVIGFQMDFVTAAYPTPVNSRPPLGGLIYDPPATGVINFPGDTDSFTINLDPGQTITVLVDPAGETEDLYGGVGNGSGINPGGLLRINQANGSGTFIGDPVTPGGITGLVYDAAAGVFFGSTIRNAGPFSTLVRIDPVTGGLLSTVGTITDGPGGPAISIGDLAIQPGAGTLFGVRSNASGPGGGFLYTINKTTGVATFVGDTGGGAGGGIAFAPDGSLYQSGFNSFLDFTSLNKINPANASRISTVPIGGYFDGLGIRADGTIFATPGGSDAIYVINPNTGDLTFIGATGAGLTSDLAFGPSTAVAPTVELRGPPNALLASAAAGSGQNALLQTVTGTTGGVYTIRVTGTSGTGLYTVGVTLNAALEREGLFPGAGNNAVATAQDLNPSFVNLTTTLTSAGRGGAVGTGDGAGGYQASAVPFDFTDISGTGTPVLQGTDDGVWSLSPADLGDFTFNFYGQTYNSIFFSTNGLITFGSGDDEFSNDDLTDNPDQAAIAPLWDDMETFSNSGAVYWQVLGSGSNQQLVLQWNNVSYYSFNPPVITFQAILSEADGSIRFNYLNLDAGVFQDGGASATVGIKNAGPQGADRLLLAFNNGPNQFVGSGQSTLIQTVVPTADYYSFSLAAGQKVTVAVSSLTGKGLHLELRNGSDVVLATGAGAANLTAVINNFTAPTTGTYYIFVTGAGPYGVVVTRDAAFDTEASDDFTSAQDITGTHGVLGHVVGGIPALPLQNFDDGLLTGYTFLGDNNASVTGAAAHDGPFGLEIGDPTEWFYRDDAAVHVQQGDTISLWVQAATDPFGRLYIGFGATSNGTLSMVMSSNTGELILQENIGFGFNALAAVDQSWEAGKWYRFQITWGIDGSIVGDVFDSDGSTLLNSVSATDTNITSGGLAFRGFGATYYVDTVQKGVPSNEDWYAVTLAPSQTVLNLETRSPGDGPGEFVNTLNPHIELYSPAGVLLASGIPLADGRNEVLQLANLAPGTYRIRIVGENSSQGEYYLGTQALRTPTPTTVVDNRNSGFRAYGSGWNLVAGGYNGDRRTHAGGGTGATNYVEFSYGQNFTARTHYEFFATWVANAANASNAKYKIYDGATLLTTVTVNQQVSPNTALVNGSLWQSLYLYTPLTTGYHVIRIRIGDDANGVVVADAIFDPPVGDLEDGLAGDRSSERELLLPDLRGSAPTTTLPPAAGRFDGGSLSPPARSLQAVAAAGMALPLESPDARAVGALDRDRVDQVFGTDRWKDGASLAVARRRKAAPSWWDVAGTDLF
jgi:hypothetical protein